MVPTHRTDDRAQTTLDFAIAMGVFLLTVAFVFTFIPSLTAPFIDGNQEQTAAADRVASHLSEGSLAEPDDPYVLDVACTTGFFNQSSGTYVDGCGYDTGTGDYRERIGVSQRPNVNITIARTAPDSADRTLLCNDGSDNVVEVTSADCDPASDGVVYRIGDDPSNAQSVTVARRVVTIDGQDATLFVRVW